MGDFTKKLVEKVQTVNNMSFDEVAVSIGYIPEKLLESVELDDDKVLIDLLFLKHPNSLKEMY